MTLVNGGYLHSSLKGTKKIGSSHLKNSGERSRAILALLLSYISKPNRIIQCKFYLWAINAFSLKNSFITVKVYMQYGFDERKAKKLYGYATSSIRL